MKEVIILLLSILGSIVLLSDSQKVDFTGHQVVRLEITNQSQLDIIDNLVEKHYLDVWSENPLDIRLPPHLRNLFIKEGIKQSIYIKDIQSQIDLVDAEIKEKSESDHFFDTFRKSTEVFKWIDNLKA